MDQIEEVAQRLFQMCLEVHQFCKKHPDCVLAESWDQLRPSIKENYLKDARQIAQLIPQGDDGGLLTDEKIYLATQKVKPYYPPKDWCDVIKNKCREVAKAQRDLTRQEIPEAKKKMIDFIESYLVTTVEPDGTNMHHIDDAEWKSVRYRLLRPALKGE